MFSSQFGKLVLLLAAASSVSAAHDAQQSCNEIQKAISSKSLFSWPGTTTYTNDTHVYNLRAIQRATCSVEPATAEDTSKIMKIIGKNKTPFGIRSGGHNINPGFAGTKGVQIALDRFNAFKLDKDKGTLELGTGWLWDAVYEKLDPLGYSVVGARTPGPGVGGFVTGGGWGWQTNQYGCTIDNILDMQVILPSGEIVTTSLTQHPDLFWAIRGAWNNFGIVFKVTMRARKQGKVWGGISRIAADYYNETVPAIANYFKNNKDPKALLIPAFGFQFGQAITQLLFFYDAPEAPKGMYDELLNIPAFQKNVSTRSILEMTRSEGQPATGLRLHLHGIPLTGYSKSLLATIANQTQSWGVETSKSHHPFGLNYAIVGYMKSAFEKAVPAAYIRDPDFPSQPFLAQFSHIANSTDEDSYFQKSVDESARVIMQQAISEGQELQRDTSVTYGNYADASATPEMIWGANLPRLKQIKKIYDPKNIMGLAGNFKL